MNLFLNRKEGCRILLRWLGDGIIFDGHMAVFVETFLQESRV